MILIDAQGLGASRPNRPLFTDLSLTLSDGDRIGVVGLNGCGKSTLLTMMSGDREPEAGVVRRGRNARVGALPQLPVLPPGTVRAAVCDGLGRDEWQGEAMLSRLGMGGVLDASTDQLSGGQKKRVALAALLAREWDALILDEPTNHLDLDAIAYLEEWLAAFPGGLLLVTHDRHVLDRVTNKVLEIDRGATLPPRSARTDGRIRIRGIPRGADRTRSAGRDGGADAQEPRAPRARVAAARRAGAHVEAQGAHRHRQRAPRARSRRGRTRG